MPTGSVGISAGGAFGVGSYGFSYSVRGNVGSEDFSARTQVTYGGIAARATFNEDGTIDVDIGVGFVVGAKLGVNAFAGLGTTLLNNIRDLHFAASVSASLDPTQQGILPGVNASIKAELTGGSTGPRTSPAVIPGSYPGEFDYLNALDALSENKDFADRLQKAYDAKKDSPGWGNGNSPSEGGPGPGVTGDKPPAEEEKDPNEAFDADEFSDKKAGDVTTPVIIDLSPGGATTQTSDGLALYGLHNSPVFYNSDNDKFKERTAWVGPDEGIVVFTEKDGAVKDINGDGKITVAEIALTKVVNNTRTDMEALYKGFDKGYDTNNDGVVDKGANDHKIEAAEADAWGLRIWRDANVNGVIDANEMMTFAAAGIDSIDLNDTNIDELKDHAKEGSKARADDIIETRFSDGSVIFGTAEVALTNGGTTTAYDVGFAHESTGMLDHEDVNGFAASWPLGQVGDPVDRRQAKKAGTLRQQRGPGARPRAEARAPSPPATAALRAAPAMT